MAPINHRPFLRRTFAILFAALIFVTLKAQYTWSDAGPILQAKCAPCHHAPDGIGYIMSGGVDWSGDSAAHTTILTLVSPSHVISKFDPADGNYLASSRMPKWMPDETYRHFTKERVLTSAQINTLKGWLNNFPANPGASSPAKVYFPHTFTLPTTNTHTLVHPPYTVNISGSQDEYRNYAFTNTDTGTIYITKVEYLLPINNAPMIHHLALFIDQSTGPTHQSITLDSLDSQPGYALGNQPGSIGNFANSFVAAWAPGSGVFEMPCNFGIKLQPGENLVAQFHYPAGMGTGIDSTQIRFQYTTSAREAHASVLIGSGQAGDTFADSLWQATTTSESTALLMTPGQKKWIYRKAPIKSLSGLNNGDSIAVIGVIPHMHLRPDSVEMFSGHTGAKVKLIRINNWQLSMQESYMTQNPIKLKYTDSLYLRARFDNSSANPDLTIGSIHYYDSTQHAGLSTTDEMFIGILIWATYSATGGQDSLMTLDPNISGAVVANGGGPFTQHACATQQIGGSPSGSGGLGSLAYSWSTTNGIFVTSTSIANPTVSLLNADANYNLTVTDAKSCSATATALVADTGTGFLKALTGPTSTTGRILGDMVVSDSGYIYGLGWVNSDIYLDRPTPYQNYGSSGYGTFLVKYKPDICGSTLWATGDTVNNIGARDVTGAISKAHPYSGNLAVGDSGNVFTAINGIVTAGGPTTAIIRKTTRAGIKSWSTTEDSLSVTDLEADASGGVYITGFNSKGTIAVTVATQTGPNYDIIPGRNFIGKIHNPSTSLKFDWVTNVTDTASKDGPPSIKLVTENGTTRLFYASGHRLAVYNPSTGANITSAFTNISAASKVVRVTVNSAANVHKIYTVDGDNLRAYTYDSATFAITIPAAFTQSIAQCIDIAGNSGTSYLYIVTDTALQYRKFSDGTQGLTRLKYITTANATVVDKCLYPDNGKVYIGGDFPASGSPNVTVNNFSFNDSHGGSFLTRANGGNTYYAKTDGNEETSEPVVPALNEPVNGLFIYPNPAGDKLNIKTNYGAGTVVTVYNLLGVQVDKLVLDGMTNLYNIDLNTYAGGTYLLRVREPNGSLTSTRFVKE